MCTVWSGGVRTTAYLRESLEMERVEAEHIVHTARYAGWIFKAVPKERAEELFVQKELCQ